MEFKKGDVCSLEVLVAHQPTPDEVIVIVQLSAAPAQAMCVPADKITLIRRAPVDLATCDMPVEVQEPKGHGATMIARDQGWAFLRWHEGEHGLYPVGKLRPADAPAPAAEAGEVARQMLAQLLDTIGAKHLTEAETFVTRMRGEVERLRARVAQLEHGLTRCVDRLKSHVHDQYDGVWGGADFSDEYGEFEILLAATAPTSETSRPMTGMFTHMSPEKQEAALAYRGPENHGTLCQPKLNVTYTAHNSSPTCPPGHIMIGDRAVPEPMREVPRAGNEVWVSCPTWPGLVTRSYWTDDAVDLHRLHSGLIHRTEAAARAHAEAIIALSAGEGV